MIADGIYPGVPEGDYHGPGDWSDRIGASTLWQGERQHGGSMLRLRAALDGEIDFDSEDLKLGREMHCRLLTPAVYREQYVVEPDWVGELFEEHGDDWKAIANGTIYKNPMATKIVAEAREVWQIGIGNREIVTAENAASIERIAAAIQRHPVVQMLRARGGHEVSIAWTCHGIPVKSRLDKLVDAGRSGKRAILDLKSTSDISEDWVYRSVRKYGYRFKAAFYVDAVKAATGDDADFYWIFIEKKPPHEIRVRGAEDDDLAIGRSLYLPTIHEYGECLRSGLWPGVAERIEYGVTADWELKQARSAGILE